MEKNCQKGYFLVETIISLTVVATIITIVYGAVTSSFIKQNDKLTKINTTEGIYATKEIDKYFKYDLEKLEKSITNENPYVDLDAYVNDNYSTNYGKFQTFYDTLNIKELYFSKYNMESLIQKAPLAIRKSLKLENSTDENRCNYRYLLIFEDNSFATIGIDCN
mgnify:CR=1 FL=1